MMSKKNRLCKYYVINLISYLIIITSWACEKEQNDKTVSRGNEANTSGSKEDTLKELEKRFHRTKIRKEDVRKDNLYDKQRELRKSMFDNALLRIRSGNKNDLDSLEKDLSNKAYINMLNQNEWVGNKNISYTGILNEIANQHTDEIRNMIVHLGRNSESILPQDIISAIGFLDDIDEDTENYLREIVVKYPYLNIRVFEAATQIGSKKTSDLISKAVIEESALAGIKYKREHIMSMFMYMYEYRYKEGVILAYRKILDNLEGKESIDDLMVSLFGEPRPKGGIERGGRRARPPSWGNISGESLRILKECAQLARKRGISYEIEVLVSREEKAIDNILLQFKSVKEKKSDKNKNEIRDKMKIDAIGILRSSGENTIRAIEDLLTSGIYLDYLDCDKYKDNKKEELYRRGYLKRAEEDWRQEQENKKLEMNGDHYKELKLRVIEIVNDISRLRTLNAEKTLIDIGRNKIYNENTDRFQGLIDAFREVKNYNEDTMLFMRELKNNGYVVENVVGTLAQIGNDEAIKIIEEIFKSDAYSKDRKKYILEKYFLKYLQPNSGNKKMEDVYHRIDHIIH